MKSTNKLIKQDLYTNLVINVTYFFLKVEDDNLKKSAFKRVKEDIRTFKIYDASVDRDSNKVKNVSGNGTIFSSFLKKYLSIKFPNPSEYDFAPKNLTFKTYLKKHVFGHINPDDYWPVLGPIFRGFELGNVGAQEAFFKHRTSFLRIGDSEIYVATYFPKSEISEEKPSLASAVADFTKPNTIKIRENIKDELENPDFDDLDSLDPVMKKRISNNSKMLLFDLFGVLQPDHLAFSLSMPEGCTLRKQLYDLYADMLEEFEKFEVQSEEVKDFLVYSKKFFE